MELTDCAEARQFRAMPVGTKISHSDPDWYQKEKMRQRACERQRAKRERDRALLRQLTPQGMPRVVLTFSKTNLQAPPSPFGEVDATIRPGESASPWSLYAPLSQLLARVEKNKAAAMVDAVAAIVAVEKGEAEEKLAAQARELEEMRTLLAARDAQIAATAAAPPPDENTPPLPKQQRRARPIGQTECECGCDGNYVAHAQQAFAGEGRNEDSAGRAARRAIERVNQALPEDMEQRGAVLQSVVCQPCNTEAVATVGLRTAADATRAERYMDRQAAAIASMKIKAGSMCKDIQTALDSFITMLAPIANSTVLQRGKEAKAARAAGIAVPQAKVCGAREFAKDFGLSLSTAYKHLKASIERRAKLDAAAEGAYWTWTRLRTGCGVKEETRRLVLAFYLNHPGIKRSPLRDDTLLLPNEEGEKVRVAKLLSEVSLTDVYLDFEREHPGLIKERAFRYLAPPELRRMTARHLDMCGCRYLLCSLPSTRFLVLATSQQCSFSGVCRVTQRDTIQVHTYLDFHICISMCV